MSDYYDLGNHRRTISTDSPDAQLWFDRGLNWTYGFHHEEAIVCFEQALIASAAPPFLEAQQAPPAKDDPAANTIPATTIAIPIIFIMYLLRI